MKKIILLITVVVYTSCNLYAQTAAPAGKGFNHSSFTAEKKIITTELQALTDKQFYEHPEFGVLPYNAPCKDCIELLQKRDASHRYFVKNGSHGKEFYQQSSYGSLSYAENGVLRTIDSRLQPSEQSGVYRAARQPFPVTINVPEKFTSILNAGKELQVNRNVNIFIKHNDGSVTSLGEPDWSNYTAGDDGVIIHNFYPGIDLELRPGVANIESFYRMNKPLPLGDGWLVIRDNMNVPQGLVYDYTHCEKLENNYYEGTLFINSPEGTHYFYIGAPAAYDENNEHDNAINLNYQIADNGVYDLYVPTAWMNDAKRSYPLIIDPFVTATDTLPLASITGSGYDSTCFQNGCTYNLNVAIPAASIVTDITYGFNYRSLGTCHLRQGAWDLSWGACRSPSAGGVYHTCTIDLPGLCILQNLSCYTDFQPCLPAPQCATYNIPMVMTFYRCAQPGAGCGFSCINADTNWDMTVTGRTVDAGFASDNISVCRNNSITLSVIDTIGVGPISFNWNPGALTGNHVSVTPTSNTTYTVTVTDGCGTTSTNTIIVVVDTVKSPAYITSSATDLCSRTDTILLSANTRTGLAYQWQMNGLPISGATDSSFLATWPLSGDYSCIVSTGCGGTTSNVIPIQAIYANFSLSADTSQLHHYIGVNMSTGAPPLKYDWSWGDGSPDDTIPYPSHTYADSGIYDICLYVTDSNGCGDQFCDYYFHILRTTNYIVYVNIIPPIITGTKETILQNQGMDIYPNPAKDELFISSSFSGNKILTVYNALGEIIYTEETNRQQETINCKPFPVGMYFLQMKTESGSVVKRFVKE